ncbi:MAG: hypothetical protein MJ142_03115 [Clostridia bacterium]|nr:hypothetical protein [Clostridia bacterium]
MRLFSDHLPFYKANFHCHTTCSDGQASPAESMELYRKAGYDILAITDHRRVTLPENVPDGLLMIPGIEMDYLLPDQCIHLIGLGMSSEIGTLWSRSIPPQEAIDTVIRLGGAAFLAHPAWSLNTPGCISSLKNLCGVEIWNSVSAVPYNADRADSSAILDVTWSSGGQLLPVFANDDVHFYGSDLTVAATVVQAESLTLTAVLQALKSGRFYATLGPEIRQIEVTDTAITVSCSEADTIIFYSNLAWVKGRSRTGHGMTSSVYDIQPGERFVRVEIRDTQGRKAWSAPIPVNGYKA